MASVTADVLYGDSTNRNERKSCTEIPDSAATDSCLTALRVCHLIHDTPHTNFLATRIDELQADQVIYNDKIYWIPRKRFVECLMETITQGRSYVNNWFRTGAEALQTAQANGIIIPSDFLAHLHAAGTDAREVLRFLNPPFLKTIEKILHEPADQQTTLNKLIEVQSYGRELFAFITRIRQYTLHNDCVFNVPEKHPEWVLHAHECTAHVRPAVDYDPHQLVPRVDLQQAYRTIDILVQELDQAITFLETKENDRLILQREVGTAKQHISNLLARIHALEPSPTQEEHPFVNPKAILLPAGPFDFDLDLDFGSAITDTSNVGVWGSPTHGGWGEAS